MRLPITAAASSTARPAGRAGRRPRQHRVAHGRGKPQAALDRISVTKNGLPEV